MMIKIANLYSFPGFAHGFLGIQKGTLLFMVALIIDMKKVRWAFSGMILI